MVYFQCKGMVAKFIIAFFKSYQEIFCHCSLKPLMSAGLLLVTMKRLSQAICTNPRIQIDKGLKVKCTLCGIGYINILMHAKIKRFGTKHSQSYSKSLTNITNHSYESQVYSKIHDSIQYQRLRECHDEALRLFKFSSLQSVLPQAMCTNARIDGTGILNQKRNEMQYMV